jgi:hypothetical protein
MPIYFFDFRAGQAFSLDEEGEDFVDIDEVHRAAVSLLASAVNETMVEGAADQLAIEVRDELGPVLEVSAVVRSKIFRTQ